MIKKHSGIKLFLILGVLICNIALSAVVYAIDGSIAFNSGAITLSTDDGNSIANIGDQITIDVDVDNTDDNPTACGTTTTIVLVDLSAFGGSATQAMTCNTADGANNYTYQYVHTIADGGGSAIDVGVSTATVAFDIDDGDETNLTPTSSALAEAADTDAPTIGTPGTIALTDTSGEGAASIGENLTYAAGTPGAADGDSWTVDLSPYALSATQAPGTVAVVADDDDGAFSGTETITDNAGNTATGAATITGGFTIDNEAPVITVPGTVTLSNDIEGDGIASIGDTITYAAGTVSAADGDIWDVDLSAYGLSATAAPGGYVVIADNDDGAFSATESVLDNGDNTTTGAVTLSGFTNIDNIDPIITAAGTVTLSNDINGDGIASIGDTITYAAGTVSVADGDAWEVDLSAYGLSVTAAPGGHVVVADNDDGAFSATESVFDDADNSDSGAVTLSGFTNIDNVAPIITVPGTVTLSNDVNGDGLASIGDTITYAAGTVSVGDSDVWDVDLSAYGLSATAAPGGYVVAADDDDGAFSATESVFDDADNSDSGAVTLSGFTNIDNEAPVISVAGTITLSNDLNGDGFASVGDTITYAAGTDSTGDGGTAWTVDLSAYGLSATAVPAGYVVIADDDDGAFSATETAMDEADNSDTGAVTLSGFTNIDNIAPLITGAGTVTLSNDINGDGLASIGDTITYAAGTVSVADGDAWTVDLSAYGLSATAAPAGYVVIADNDDGAFSATETATDNGGNIDTGAVTLSGFTNIDNVAPTITVPGTVTLTNDVNGDGLASVGDTITYVAGTEGTGDGAGVIPWSVDLSAYGLNAATTPGAYAVVADDDDGAFSATETATDDAENATTGGVTAVGFANIDNEAPVISVAGTVTLTGDVNGDGFASIGDTITYAAGTDSTGDGGTAWTVDLSAYGLSATAAPGGYAVIADDDDGAFSATETAMDEADNSDTGAVTLSGFTNIDNVDPTLTVPGTVTLSNDVNGDGFASVGDDITYAAGTEGTGDTVNWTVDLSAYGLSATAAPGIYTIIVDNDDVAFAATEIVHDDAENTDTGAVTLVGFTNIDNIDPTITAPGTFTLTIDNNTNGIAEVGDTVTYNADGTEGTGDTLAAAAWTVDITTLTGNPADTAAPAGAYVVGTGTLNGAIQFTESVHDDAENTASGNTVAINVNNNAPGVLTSTSVTPALTTVNSTTSYTVAFTNAQIIPADGKVQVTFPAQFDVSTLDTTAGLSLTNIDGTLTAAVVGQVVTLTRGGGATAVPAATNVSFLVTPGTNGATAGATGTFTIRTLTSTDSTIDEDAAVAAVNLTDGGGGGGGGGGGTAGGTRRTTTTDDETTTEEDTATEEEASEVTGFTDTLNHWGEPYIEEAYTEGYVEGYEDKTFLPDQYITRAEAAKLIALWLNINVGDSDCDGAAFSDVSCSEWYGKYIGYLFAQEIVEGYDNGNYGPGMNVGRAEALKMLLYAKMLQDTDFSGTENPFNDVNMDQWFYNVVMVGYKMSIVQGYDDGTFRPGNNVTRAEFVKMFTETLLK